MIKVTSTSAISPPSTEPVWRREEERECVHVCRKKGGGGGGGGGERRENG